MSGLFHTHQTPEHSVVGAPGIVAFSCGVILLYQLTLLPPPWWLFLVGLLMVSASLLIRQGTMRRLVRLLALLVLGLAWAGWHSEARLAERLPADMEGKRLELSGYVCELPQAGSFSSLRFSVCVVSWHSEGQQGATPVLPRRVRLSWYGRNDQALPGHRLRLEVVLKRPHGNLNPEGFRYEDWLFRKGYRATGSVRAVALDQDLHCGWHCRYHAWHQTVAEQVHRHFSDAGEYPLIASLLIGHRGYLTDRHWQTLRATGTIHLVAISGLHLGLVAVGAGLVARRFTLSVPAHWLDERRRRIAGFALVILCCLFYALVAGFTVPTRRALIMVLVGGWYLLLAREASVWRPFCSALFLVLLLDPFAPLDQGFWLSFGAVAVLLAVFSGRLAGPGWLKGLVLAQVAVFAGLWPLLSGLGQSQPLAGLVANLVAIPWVSLVVMPVLFAGALLVLVSGGAVTGWVSSLLDAVLGPLMAWLQWVEQLAAPVSVLTPEASPFLLTLLAAVVVLLLRFPDRVFRLMTVALVGAWAVTAVLTRPAAINPEVVEPEIRVWDVGQGLSVLVRVGRKALVYDTGPEVRGVFSAVDSTLLPNLRALGINKLDRLIISHGDSDHAGGLVQLVQAVDVEQIQSGEPEVVAGILDEVPGKSVGQCRSEPFEWHGVVFEFWQSQAERTGNDASCVVRVHHPASGSDVLLTGDISKRVEAEMLASGAVPWLRKAVDFRLVLAPHHGSKTSSSAPWIDRVAPDWVIYTAGYRHRYGHPHPDVVARYQLANARPLNTACSGEIVITLSKHGPKISELRHTVPFWIQGPGLTRDQCKIP